MRSGTSLAIALLAGTSLIGATAPLYAAPAAVAIPVVPPASAAVPPTSTIQQQFDAGTAAIAAGEWTRALEIYTALETKLAARTPLSKSLAVVRLRKGQALNKLGRRDEAVATINVALPNMSQNDPALADDRSEAISVLADFDERRFDYSAAVAHWRSALAISPTPLGQLRASYRLIQIGIFVDPVAALADSDAALALVAKHPEANKDWVGTLHDLRGRTLLNLGRIKEARAELKTAISLLGVLAAGGRINLSDAAARSDAAIAALRDNDFEAARRFLAYSGSVNQSDDGFPLGKNMVSPACGGTKGPQPDDVAVVEFNIREDGGVGFARPVFFSGKRDSAVEFARAVAGWSWKPDELAAVKPFYRAQTRIELRCTMQFSRPETQSLLASGYARWAELKSIKSFTPSGTNEAQQMAQLNLELVARTTREGASSINNLPLLVALSQNNVVDQQLRANYANRAYATAIAAQAPAVPRAYLGLNAWRFFDGSWRGNPRDKYHLAVAAGLTDGTISTDAAALATLRIAYFDSLDVRERDGEGVAALRAIAADDRLPASDPYRVGALTRLASYEFGKGQVDAARSLFEKTGLSAQQCALVDATPLQTKGRVSASDYPEGAFDFGFGGWAVVEFDIDASGATTNRRPVVAWPPFMFGEPIANGVRRFKYQQTYRPGGTLGCSAQQYAQRFRFSRGN